MIFYQIGRLVEDMKLFGVIFYKFFFKFQLFSNTALVRPLAALPMQTQFVPVAPAVPTQFSAVRSFKTSSVTKDIDSAAKFIGAGAATVGVAGSGTIRVIKNGFEFWILHVVCVTNKVMVE